MSKIEDGDRLRPGEIKAARRALGLSLRGMARALQLSGANGNDRILDWEEGRLPISGPASQCIRLWLALHGLGPEPLLPEGREREKIIPLGKIPA